MCEQRECQVPAAVAGKPSATMYCAALGIGRGLALQDSHVYVPVHADLISHVNA
jgi:hypothetical protein